MVRELSTRELDDLLGPFALDAVDDDEREQIERYLRRSPRARALVAEYRETAAFLVDAGIEAPTELWDRIEQRLAEAPPPEAAPEIVPLAPRRSVPARRVAAAVAAAAAVVIVTLLAVKVVQQDDRISDLARDTERGGVLAAADAASRDPSATKVRLSSPDGALAARLVYRPAGDGFLVESSLRPLPSDLTYQLWARVGDPDTPRTISAGVLGPDPGVAAFRVRGPILGFTITAEEGPGVVSPANPAVAQGSVD
jgi:hypothetical protein